VDGSFEQKHEVSATKSRRPRVVILGAGFAGLNAAQHLATADVDLTVIDRRNYHLFQPLLYQVATAGLSPAQIAAPIRKILSRQRNSTVLMARVTAIDIARRIVSTDGPTIAYDYLIVATGARHHYFGNKHWERYAPGLKKLEDATSIRARLLSAFERAEAISDDTERRSLLTFVVVGGGPTGVELAGAIAELAKRTIAADFRHIDPRSARVVLVEASERVLATFPERLSTKATSQLEALGVEVLTRTAVADLDAGGVTLRNGSRIDSSCVVWAAGVMASPAAKWLGAAHDSTGRVHVHEDLSLEGHPEVFVAGDTASAADGKGGRIPGVAPAAKQMGVHAANAILARIEGRRSPAFRYRSSGSLSTIGRRAAVADIAGIELWGSPAWLAWCFVHVWFLIRFRNRLSVFADWTWSYFTYDRSVRLITGPL
jgi:NADH dehydrogenase